MGQISLGFFTFYREVYGAVTDFGFYRTILDQPPRRTMLYLLFLSAHVAVVLTLLYAWYYGPRLTDFSQWAQTNLPSFRVRGGTLEVEGEQPIVRLYERDQTWTFVFDTTGKSEARSFDEPAFIFGREKLHIRLNEVTQTYEWRDFEDFQKSELRGLEQFVRWAYFPLGYSFWLIYTLMSKALLGLFLTVFAMASSARHQVRLPFGRYFNLAAYALTPAVIIDLAVSLTGQFIPFLTVIYLATAAIYTYLATQKCVTAD